MPIRILLIIDDSVFGDTLRSAIESDLRAQLVTCVDSLPTATSAIAQCDYDVVVIESSSVFGNVAKLVGAIARQCPLADVMVASVFGTEASVLAAIEAGATGFLLKRTPLDAASTLSDVCELRAGRAPITPVVANGLLQRFKSAAEDGLAQQDRDVLTRFSKGFTAAEIAHVLRMPRAAVGTAVKRAYRRLHAQTRMAGHLT